MVIVLLPIDSGIWALALPETTGVPFTVRVAVWSVTVGVTAHVVVFTETK
jgi:hypothetical protein